VWWESVGTASAAITIVHLVAIVGFAYVAVVATLVTVADAFRLGAFRHTVLRAATPGLRRTLTAGAFVAAATAPALADESMIVVTDIGAAPPSVTEIVVHDLGPVPRSLDRGVARVARPDGDHATPRVHGTVDHRPLVGRTRRQPLGDR
jgi:hypothetical protein